MKYVSAVCLIVAALVVLAQSQNNTTMATNMTDTPATTATDTPTTILVQNNGTPSTQPPKTMTPTPETPSSAVSLYPTAVVIFVGFLVAALS